ncbi:MAG: DUF4340 domain-containing protein [Chloroflexi bacterium]|nr:DUF4340 domain-containing protein [Chloroflexota bacterium]
MGSKQVGYVLIALIAIGVVGLVLRLIAAGSSELTLEGILPVSPDVIDRVTITAPAPVGGEARLDKINDVWQVEREDAFVPKLNQLWTAAADIDGAQLVARNPVNHERMGVMEGQGVSVAFWLGEFKQEEFIVGNWSPEVRLCYLRKPARNEVYAIPCPYGNIFDSSADGWRDPVVASIPRDAIEVIEYEYPEGSFVLRRVERGWIVEGADILEPANVFAVNAVLATLEGFIASGFAPEQETENLDFTGPQGISVRIITNEDLGYPTTRVRLLPRDDLSFYATTPRRPNVFLIGTRAASGLLLTLDDFIAVPGP